MKLQTILLLTGTAAGLMTASCQSSTEAEAEAFYGTTYPKEKKVTTEDEAEAKNKADFYSQVSAHIDRRLNEFNEKEEVKLPVFSSKEVKDEFMDLSFIRTSEQLRLLFIDFAGPKDESFNVFFGREPRMFNRTIDGKLEEYTFAPFTDGVPRAIPYDVHILYALIGNFNRIAETVSIRNYEKLEKGENPAIAKQENEANLDEKGRKKDKNFVEIKPKVTYEPIEYRIDNRWCKCYDVKLKSICAPATALALYVSNEEKTIARMDVILDDDSKESFIIDWRRESENAREQDGSVLSRTTDDSTNQDLQDKKDGIVLPRVIRRLSDNGVFFRRDATPLMLKEESALDELKDRIDILMQELTDMDADADADDIMAKMEIAVEVNETWERLKGNLKGLNTLHDPAETASIMAEIRADLNTVKTRYRDAETGLNAVSEKIAMIKERAARAEMNSEEEDDSVEIDASEDASDEEDEGTAFLAD